MENVNILRLSKEYFRYCIVGAIVTGIDFLLLICEVELLHIHYLTAAFISYTTAAVIHYFLSAKYVFTESETEQNFSAFMIFLLLGVLGLGLYELMMFLSVHSLGMHYILAKVFATGVSFTFNFLSRKYLLFN